MVLVDAEEIEKYNAKTQKSVLQTHNVQKGLEALKEAGVTVGDSKRLNTLPSTPYTVNSYFRNLLFF